VIEINDQGTRATLEIVPRVDYAALKLPKDQQKERYKTANQAGGTRPSQGLFQPNKVTANGGGLEIGTAAQNRDGYMKHNGKWFARNGMIHWDMMINRFTANAVPHKDELIFFQEALKRIRDEKANYENSKEDGDGSDEEAELMKSVEVHKTKSEPEKIAASLARNDTIIITDGDLKNLKCTVYHVNLRNMQVTATPNIPGKENEKYSFDVADVKKVFLVGQHIKVINGRYLNETGNVIDLKMSQKAGELDQATILTDVTKRTVTVPTRHLRITQEVYVGASQRNGYALGDLVSLGGNTRAVILQVGRETFSVLTQAGVRAVVKTAELHANLTRTQGRRSLAKDQNGKKLQPGDVVKVAKGHLTGATGQVMYDGQRGLIVFVKATNRLENKGYFVAKAGNCDLVGDETDTSVEISSNYGRLREKTTGSRRDQMDHLNKYKNKTFKIVKGRYKGYTGTVINASAETLRIELHAKMKTITVSVTDARDMSRNAQRHRGMQQRGMAFGMGVAGGSSMTGNSYNTPADFVGGTTPGLAHLGGQTPGMYAGGRTPGGHTPGGRTPGGSVMDDKNPFNNPNRATTPYRPTEADEYEPSVSSRGLNSSVQNSSAYGHAQDAQQKSWDADSNANNINASSAAGDVRMEDVMEAEEEEQVEGYFVPDAQDEVWVQKDTWIQINYPSEPDYHNQRGIVEIRPKPDEQVQDTEVVVQLMTDQNELSDRLQLPMRNLKPVEPKKGDLGMVLTGDDAGKVGTIQTVSAGDAVLMTADQDMILEKIKNIAKYQKVE
jgi:transcription elongation factor SPT5